jgi:hypothetical protein
MKRRLCIGAVTLLVTLVLAVPASATRPEEVSGTRQFTPPVLNRVWRPAGNNCFVEIDATYSYTGDLVGTSTHHFWIVSHGPCEENGPVPYKYHETIHTRGTFSGSVSGMFGTFDFVETAQNWPTDSGGHLYTSHMVILSGTGDLANLHGMLDVSGSDYSGQIHFDPQP